MFPRPSIISCGGRSPRARGRRNRSDRTQQAQRSIPACAGEAVLEVGTWEASQVDPRVRGGGHQSWRRLIHRCGRSPRARGRRAGDSITVTLPRSIPACAGEAAPHPDGAFIRQVDPRVRGGGRVHFPMAWSSFGRSPRARGRPGQTISPLQERGSIPACAGEALRHGRVCQRDQVDPRVRGGGPASETVAGVVEGRSPRARGRQDGLEVQRLHHRSIPACAGEATRASVASSACGVDPRVRGGGVTAAAGAAHGAGRSPRARGRRSVPTGDRWRSGSIPACAGEAASLTWWATSGRVDPRVRGGGCPPPSALPSE